MAGYSGKPLSAKLGLKEDVEVFPVGAPENYRELLGSIPDGVRFVEELTAATDLVHHFTASEAELAEALPAYRSAIRPDAMVWVSWPKKASKVPTDVTEDTVRKVALPLGLVDVKVCAVSEVYSGLKLVIRKELR